MEDEFPVAVLVAGCIDDDQERNDTASAARSLGGIYEISGTLSATGLYAHNDDWYGVYVSGSYGVTSLAVALTTTDAIPVEFYGPDGKTLLASGTNGLTAPVSGSQYYRLRVKPGALASSCGAPYDLSIVGQWCSGATLGFRPGSRHVTRSRDEGACPGSSAEVHWA
jgi:hypothetical protein